jgi:hypothetical protein
MLPLVILPMVMGVWVWELINRTQFLGPGRCVNVTRRVFFPRVGVGRSAFGCNTCLINIFHCMIVVGLEGLGLLAFYFALRTRHPFDAK